MFYHPWHILTSLESSRLADSITQQRALYAVKYFLWCDELKTTFIFHGECFLRQILLC